MAKKLTKEEKALITGKNSVYVKTDKEFIGYQGSVPFVEFDENWIQMPLDRTKTIIPREHLTRMFPLGYLAGKLSVLKKMESLSLIMILILIGAIAAAALAGFNIYSTGGKLNTQEAAITAVRTDLEYTNNALNNIAEKLNITIEQPKVEQVG